MPQSFFTFHPAAGYPHVFCAGLAVIREPLPAARVQLLPTVVAHRQVVRLPHQCFWTKATEPTISRSARSVTVNESLNCFKPLVRRPCKTPTPKCHNRLPEFLRHHCRIVTLIRLTISKLRRPDKGAAAIGRNVTVTITRATGVPLQCRQLFHDARAISTGRPSARVTESRIHFTIIPSAIMPPLLGFNAVISAIRWPCRPEYHHVRKQDQIAPVAASAVAA